MQCFKFNEGVNPDTQQDADFWGFQFCTEMFQPMSRDGVKDSFFSQPWNMTAAIQDCQEQWGVTPRTEWATISFGGRNIKSASNIVWTNGHMDPWSGGGVLESLSDTLIAIVIKDGAHHLDLMWSNPLDPQSVLDARQTQKDNMWKWIGEAHTNRGSSGQLSRSKEPSKQI